MKVDHILGKIVAITRGIYLSQPSSYSRVNGFATPRGGQTFLWLTTDAIRQTRELSAMIRELDVKYSGASVAAIQIEIDLVIKANLWNHDLFDMRRLRADKSSLFDIAVGGAKKFATELWKRILAAVKKLQPTWLILYPLRGVTANSLAIGFDGLSIMAPNDEQTWNKYAARYPSTTSFNPAQGSPERFSAPTMWGIKSPIANENRVFSWLICEIEGTQSGVSRLAADRMRTVIALLFAYWHPSSADFLTFKSDLGEHRYGLQFAPVGNRREDSIAPVPTGRLMPSFPVDFVISSGIIAQLQNWYSRLRSAEEELQRRAVTASHYVHHAIMADGLERFIHYYITLDAMFGEVKKVEANFKTAINSMFASDALWEYRANHLYDLRNALIHGGTSSIDGWKDLSAYMKHVKSSPSEDIARCAMTGLRHYFELAPAVFNV